MFVIICRFTLLTTCRIFVKVKYWVKTLIGVNTLKTYRYELHMHSRDVSMCAHISIEDEIALYKSSGYDGVVLTNHYSSGWFESLGNIPWSQKVNAFLSPYLRARELSPDSEMAVILGMELTFAGTANDYLVYGIDRDFLLKYPALYKSNLSDFRKIADDNRLYVAQAHPFRPWMTRADPHLLDGIEACNAHPGHASHNELAERFGREHGLIMTSGSDCHEYGHAATAATYLTERVTTSKELAALLLSKKGIAFYEPRVLPE